MRVTRSFACNERFSLGLTISMSAGRSACLSVCLFISPSASPAVCMPIPAVSLSGRLQLIAEALLMN